MRTGTTKDFVTTSQWCNNKFAKISYKEYIYAHNSHVQASQRARGKIMKDTRLLLAALLALAGVTPLHATTIQLLYPPDIRTTSDRTPTVQWSITPYGSYISTVKFSTNSDFSPLLFSQTGISTDNYTLNGTAPELLTRGATYYWRVETAHAASAPRSLIVPLNRLTYTLDVAGNSPMAPPLALSRRILTGDLFTPTTSQYALLRSKRGSNPSAMIVAAAFAVPMPVTNPSTPSPFMRRSRYPCGNGSTRSNFSRSTQY